MGKEKSITSKDQPSGKGTYDGVVYGLLNLLSSLGELLIKVQQQTLTGKRGIGALIIKWMGFMTECMYNVSLIVMMYGLSERRIGIRVTPPVNHRLPVRLLQ